MGKSRVFVAFLLLGLLGCKVQTEEESNMSGGLGSVSSPSSSNSSTNDSLAVTNNQQADPNSLEVFCVRGSTASVPLFSDLVKCNAAFPSRGCSPVAVNIAGVFRSCFTEKGRVVPPTPTPGPGNGSGSGSGSGSILPQSGHFSADLGRIGADGKWYAFTKVLQSSGITQFALKVPTDESALYSVLNGYGGAKGVSFSSVSLVNGFANANGATAVVYAQNSVPIEVNTGTGSLNLNKSIVVQKGQGSAARVKNISYTAIPRPQQINLSAEITLVGQLASLGLVYQDPYSGDGTTVSAPRIAVFSLQSGGGIAPKSTTYVRETSGSIVLTNFQHDIGNDYHGTLVVKRSQGGVITVMDQIPFCIPFHEKNSLYLYRANSTFTGFGPSSPKGQNLLSNPMAYKSLFIGEDDVHTNSKMYYAQLSLSGRYLTTQSTGGNPKDNDAGRPRPQNTWVGPEFYQIELIQAGYPESPATSCQTIINHASTRSLSVNNSY